MAMISGDLEEYCNFGQIDYDNGFKEGILLSLKILSKHPEIKKEFKKEFRRYYPELYICNFEKL